MRRTQPENILLHHTGHVMLTDFDLSYGKGVTVPRLEKVPEARVIQVRAPLGALTTS